MKTWKTILEIDYAGLTDTNHVFNLKELPDLAAIYGAAIVNESGPTTRFSKEYKVPAGPSTSLWSSKGLAYQYAIHISSDGDMYWEMIEDYLVRSRTLNGLKISAYNTGFINGRAHPFGPYAGPGMASANMVPGYILWMDITVLSFPALVGEFDDLKTSI